MQSSRSVATAETVLDSMGLLLTSHRRGRCLVVDVCGNVGAGTEGQLHTRLRAALESDLLLIAVNLAQAVLADACALEVLTSIHRRAAAASKIFLVVAPDPQAHETMRITGLDQSLLVFPTVADFNAWNGHPAARLTCDLGPQPAGRASSRRPRVVRPNDGADRRTRRISSSWRSGFSGSGCLFSVLANPHFS
jgi:anti-anti-sigma factor